MGFYPLLPFLLRTLWLVSFTKLDGIFEVFTMCPFSHFSSPIFTTLSPLTLKPGRHLLRDTTPEREVIGASNLSLT